MAGELEAVLLGHGGGPLFNGAAIDFLGAAALGAYQVVVMGVGIAMAVQGFAIGHVEGVHCIDIGQGLQGAVHGGQAHLFLTLLELVVDLLGGGEFLHFPQYLNDCGALLGIARA